METRGDPIHSLVGVYDLAALGLSDAFLRCLTVSKGLSVTPAKNSSKIYLLKLSLILQIIRYILTYYSSVGRDTLNPNSIFAISRRKMADLFELHSSVLPA